MSVSIDFAMGSSLGGCGMQSNISESVKKLQIHMYVYIPSNHNNHHKSGTGGYLEMFDLMKER
jgi:hypothetical protein